MSSPPPRRRRGSHRTGRDVAGALLPSLLAVLAVAALVTSLAVWRGEEPTQPRAAAATGAASAATREALSEAPASSAVTTPATTAAPVSTTPSSTPAKAAERDLEVVVLNQTTRSGLAGTVAGVLRGKGWAVPAVGNFHGTVPATTVYSPPGAEAAAQTAAEDLPTAPRIRPRFGNLSTSRLTVVVADGYPG